MASFGGTVGAFVLVGVLILVGCLGPPRGAEDPKEAYPNRTEIVIAPAAGVSAREPNCTQGGCSEYYLVLITGSENVTQIKGTPAQHGTCSRPWRYDVNPQNQSVVYNGSAYEIDPRTMRTIIGETMWGVTISGKRYVDGCPNLYGLHPFYPTNQNPYPARSATIGNYGPMKFTVYRDGLIAFGEDYFVSLGKKLIVSYARLVGGLDATFYVEGGFEIVNVGPWPSGNLWPGQGTAVTRGPG